MKEWKQNGSVIVSWCRKHPEDRTILLVGKQTNENMEILNVFTGEEAETIFKKLTERGQKDA